MESDKKKMTSKEAQRMQKSFLPFKMEPTKEEPNGCTAIKRMDPPCEFCHTASKIKKPVFLCLIVVFESNKRYLIVMHSYSINHINQFFHLS